MHTSLALPFAALLLALSPSVIGEITVVQHPQSVQTPLYKDITLQCGFKFSDRAAGGRLVSAGQLSVEKKSSIQWLRKRPDDMMFQPVVEVKTTFNGRVVSFTKEPVNEALSSKFSTLTIVRVSEEDGGQYKCIINGGQTAGGAETQLASIQIIPEITVGPSVVSMELDRPFVIQCNVTATSSQSRRLAQTGRYRRGISWKFLNVPGFDPDNALAMSHAREMAQDISVFAELGFQLSSGNRRLGVQRATMEHAGYYWCEFTASGDDESFSGTVYQRAVVRYGPAFTLNSLNQTNSTRAVRAFVGESVDLACNILSLPWGHVQWFRGDVPITDMSSRYPERLGEGQRFYRLLEKASILRMNHLLYQDRDEYTCNVTAFGTRLSWTTLLKVKDKYSAFYPLGVILAQMILIFSLIFGAEKIYVKREHQHHHENLDLNNSRKTLPVSGPLAAAGGRMNVIHNMPHPSAIVNRGGGGASTAGAAYQGDDPLQFLQGFESMSRARNVPQPAPPLSAMRGGLI